ncbi:MAG: arginine--tRNA ligase [Oscillospiraceae bacterium]|nr:arginine--tRNA ligase [Oscillospiraceae bacterium]
MANMIDAAKREIETLVTTAYNKAVAEDVLPPGGEDVIGTIDIPRDINHGDYASAWAMAAAKPLRLPPRKIAEALMERLELSGTYFSEVQVAGAGFLNFRLSDRWYRTVLQTVETMGADYGRSDVGRGEKVMVEFVSANPTGAMTIGNARGGVLGDTMAAVLDRAGYDVWREFYVNDAGNQVDLFAESLEARYIQLISGEDAVIFPENGYHGDDIKDLARIFYEEHGEKYLSVDTQTRRADMTAFGLRYNIAKMEADLERYGITFDRWFNESELYESGYLEETVDLLIAGGHTYEKDGALWLNLMDLGAEKDDVLRRANGHYTYFASDISYHRDKFIKRGFDRVIDVWGADHHGHAIRFKKILPAVGIDPERLDFLIMQLVRLTRDGETVRVSKRTGKSITLADLLDEIPKDAARFFFSSKPDTHLEFDLGLAVRQDSENPVYYIQYAHARICSLVDTLAREGAAVQSADQVDLDQVAGDYERALIKSIARLPEEVRTAARDYDPSKVNRYAWELASSFHGFYNNCRIKGAAPGVLEARLKLADAARLAIACCLAILGVSAPEKM